MNDYPIWKKYAEPDELAQVEALTAKMADLYKQRHAVAVEIARIRNRCTQRNRLGYAPRRIPSDRLLYRKMREAGIPREQALRELGQ